MANDAVLNKVLGFFGSKPRQAGEDISDKKKYDRYVTETQSKGKEPMSFEQWRKKHGSGS